MKLSFWEKIKTQIPKYQQVMFFNFHIRHFLHLHIKIQSCLYEIYQKHWIVDEIMIFLFLKSLHAELKSKNGYFNSRIFKFSWLGSQKKTCPKEFLHLLFEDKCGIFTEFIAQYLLLKEKFSIRVFLFKTLVFVMEKTQEKLLDQISNTLSVSYIAKQYENIGSFDFQKKASGEPLQFFLFPTGGV